MSDSASWDDVRSAKIQTIIAQSENVAKAQVECAKATAALNAAHAAVGRAMAAVDVAVAVREKWTAKVAESVKSYPLIGANAADSEEQA